MDGETLRLVLVATLATAALAWLVTSVMVKVGGTYERELSREQLANGERRDSFTLASVGPWVTGRAEVEGGHQELSGLIVGRTVHLRRRDCGVPFLRSQGYPEPIAELRDGEVAAKLKLKVEGDRLVGDFIGQKIEFTHQPPRITAVVDRPAHQRAYTRVVEVPSEDPLAVSTEVDEPAEMA